MIELKDLYITPVFLLIIYSLAFIFKRSIKDKKLRKFFIPALTVKICGAISLGLIYQFYYGGGDTFNFVQLGTQHVFDAFWDNPINGLKILFSDGSDKYGELHRYTSRIYYYTDSASFFVIKLASVIGIFSYHTYMVMAVSFAVFSFTGSWALYKTFVRLYPHYYKAAAWAIFFIPSIFFWGSGLLKDSITFGALGWLFYAFCQVFIFKKRIIFSIIALLISAYIIKTVKVYILLCFVPAVVVWLFIVYSDKIRNKALRIVSKPIFLSLAVLFAFFAAQFVAADSNRYSFDKISQTAKETSQWLAYESKNQGGSGYTLGITDYSATGMLKSAPAGIWVTLFRPYLWESGSVIMLLSSLESTFFLLFTLLAIYKLGVIKTLTTIKNEPFLTFALIFSLTFAFAIGVSTYNFGSLVRYKIPLLPFYLLTIVVLYEKGKKKSGSRNKLAFKKIHGPKEQVV